MRRRTKQFFKFLFYFLLIFLLLIGIGYFWPMPTLRTPTISSNVLIKSINIVDVKTGRILYNRDVWISGNTIHSIDSTAVKSYPEGIIQVNGKGKYLIPGLWDMHTHSTQMSPWLHHPLYIAHGVTSIRDMSGHMGAPDSYWAGTADRMSWNADLSNHKLLAPRYPLQSSFQINGPNAVPDSFPEFFKAESPQHIQELLQHYKAEGADFIKVYSEIDPDSYRNLAKSASNYGMHLAGHKPLGLSLREAISLGQRSFEHGRVFMFDCFPNGSALLTANNKAKAYGKFKSEIAIANDTSCAAALMDLMQINNTYWVPTLQTLKSAALADDSAYIASNQLDYTPYLQSALWWNPDLNRAAAYNTADSTQGINRQLFDLARLHVKMAAQRGVPIMVGTDVTDSNVFPGLTLHDELKELVKAGMTTVQTLQAVTIVPARFSGLDDNQGSVEAGFLADLVILNANPLNDISNTADIHGVILNGNYLDVQTLADLKADTKKLASSYHINVKYIFSLFGSPLMRKQFAD